mmetsp:Transcript_26166/g.57175  ORF Transcript_26166/g.57175 Transcript_26166/m.57175 type:complete len:94 (-) Transcript_26166:1039-1320(-)
MLVRQHALLKRPAHTPLLYIPCAFLLNTIYRATAQQHRQGCNSSKASARHHISTLAKLQVPAAGPAADWHRTEAAPGGVHHAILMSCGLSSPA